MRTNHWSESIGSTTASVRCERGTRQLVGLHRLHEPGAIEVRKHALARLEAIEPVVGRGGRCSFTFASSVRMPIRGEPVAHADLVSR